MLEFQTPIIEQHARRAIELKLTKRKIAEISREIGEQAKATKLPADLRERILARLTQEPTLSWDLAVADAVGGIAG